MGKLNRFDFVDKENLEEKSNETQETEETLQVKSPVTVMTGESPVDLTEASLGNVKLVCLKCSKELKIARRLTARLNCPECGCNDWTSESNFHMESPEKEITVRVGDIVHGSRRDTGLWRLV